MLVLHKIPTIREDYLSAMFLVGIKAFVIS
jgi:hypothetical protein